MKLSKEFRVFEKCSNKRDITTTTTTSFITKIKVKLNLQHKYIEGKYREIKLKQTSNISHRLLMHSAHCILLAVIYLQPKPN